MVYGNAEDVKSKLVADGQSPSDEIIATALKSADILIDAELSKHKIKPNPSSPVLKEAATYYATAEALQALFNGSTDEPDGVEFYNGRGERFLNTYIAKTLEEMEDDPYYIGQTHKSSRHTLEEIIL
jgi:hypothetical protein